MHNLFGDTNAVHVSVNEKGYTIEQVIDGETVAEVLDYVQYSPKKLVRTLETWVTQSVKEGVFRWKKVKSSFPIIVPVCTDIPIWKRKVDELRREQVDKELALLLCSFCLLPLSTC